MKTQTYSVHIEATPEQVYDYVSNVLRHPEWAHERLEITPSGQEFAYTVHFMGKTSGTLRPVRAERPSVFSYECEDATGLFRWTFGVAPEGSGTRLDHRVEFVRDSLMVKLTRPLLLPLMGHKMVNGGLANIKRNLEAGATAQTAP